MTNVLKVSNVSKRFKKHKTRFYALKNVSLSIEKGEIFSILGPNGAGKTTLLNVVLGLLCPDSGEVSVFGGSIQNKNVVSRIGYVSGEERFHWTLSPLDILGFGCRLRGMGKRERESRVGELVETFGLENVLKSRFDVLSTGEKMRLAFSYAMIGNPELLLLDEPTLGLDPDIAIRIRKEVKRVNKTFKTTVVLMSHYMKEVEYLSSRMAFINHGRIMDSGTIKKIKKHYPDLESYFVEMVEKKPAGEKV